MSLGVGEVKNVVSTYSLLLLDLSSALSASLLLRLALLQERLGDEHVILGGDRTIVKSRLVRSPTYRSMW